MSAADPSPAVSWAQMLDPLNPPVVLSTTLTVDGVEFTSEQHLDRYAWDHISSDPVIRAGYESSLRHRLAAAIVERLAPPVTVHIPPAPADGGQCPDFVAQFTNHNVIGNG